MKFLIFVCILLQVLDGLFTGYGIFNSKLGVDAEGNPLVKYVISLIGVVPALVLIKSLAIVVILHMRKLKNCFSTLVFIASLYTFVVATWAYIIFSGNLH